MKSSPTANFKQWTKLSWAIFYIPCYKPFLLKNFKINIMKLQIKQYEYEKKEIASKEIQLPTEICYYFETGIRRSIKIIPRFTTWNKEQYNKEEELYELIVVCLYQSSECKAEKFTIRTSDIEGIYYSQKHKHKEFVTGLIESWFNKRTKEQFDVDFDNTFSEMQCL